MKKIYAILLLFIFSFQALPLEKVGELLSSGVLTEEVQHSASASKIFIEEDKHFRYNNFLSAEGQENTTKQSFIAFDERLNQHPWLDKLIQPPNNI